MREATFGGSGLSVTMSGGGAIELGEEVGMRGMLGLVVAVVVIVVLVIIILRFI